MKVKQAKVLVKVIRSKR